MKWLQRITFSGINRYFLRNQNVLDKGENSYTSRNVKGIIFDAKLMQIREEVSASMKRKSYKVYVLQVYIKNDYYNSCSNL